MSDDLEPVEPVEEPIPPPLDYGVLHAEDAPDTDWSQFAPPNHTASRESPVTKLFGPRKIKPTARATARAAKPRVTVPNRKGQFVAPLTQMYTTMAIVIMPFDAVCANAVMGSAEDCAKALDEMAYTNEAVRRALWSLVQTSALGAVIVAHLPILLAVMMHHVPAMQRVMGQMGADMAEQIAKQMEQTTAEETP